MSDQSNSREFKRNFLSIAVVPSAFLAVSAIILVLSHSNWWAFVFLISGWASLIAGFIAIWRRL
jgi:hypothetical protein